MIESAAREFGFERAHMELGGYIFEYQHEPATSCTWEVSIPLSEFDSVVLAAAVTETSSPGVVAPLASMLHRCLSSKLASFGAQSERARGGKR